jgi:hypothetical protein
VLLLARLFLNGGAAKKAQANPLDFMAAIFIFMVIFGYFMILWNIFSLRYAERAGALDFEMSSIAIADRLVSFGGYGDNWTAAPQSAQSIGFASRPNELDWARISAFASLPYASQKQLLGTANDFLIRIENLDGASYAQIGQAGTGAANDSARLVEVTRLAMLNGTVVNLRVRIYGR